MQYFGRSGSSSISTDSEPELETVQLQNLHFITGKEKEDNLQRINNVTST